MVPASLRRLHRDNVVYRQLQGEPPLVNMGVIWRRDDTRATLQSFLAVIDAMIPVGQT